MGGLLFMYNLLSILVVTRREEAYWRSRIVAVRTCLCLISLTRFNTFIYHPSSYNLVSIVYQSPRELRHNHYFLAIKMLYLSLGIILYI